MLEIRTTNGIDLNCHAMTTVKENSFSKPARASWRMCRRAYLPSIGQKAYLIIHSVAATHFNIEKYMRWAIILVYSYKAVTN